MSEPEEAKATRVRRPLRLEDLRVEKRGRWTHYYDSRDRRVCGAKLPGKHGQRCSHSGRSLGPSGRCRRHGGAPGAGRPPKDGGRLYADFLADRRERFAQLLERPDLLLTDPQVGLFDLAIEQALEEAAQGKGRAWREALEEASVVLAEAVSSRPTMETLAAWAADVGRAASVLAELLRRGLKADADERRVLELAERRAAMAVAERRQQVLEGDNWPAKAVLASYGRIADIILRELPEREAHRLVEAISRALVGTGREVLLGSPAAAPGSRP